MKHAIPAAILGAALAFSLGTARAANPVWSDAPGFNDLDKNGDGQLSLDEAKGNPSLAKRFKSVDEDHDGKLSRSEYLKTMAAKDWHNLREKAADIIEPGDQSSSGTSSSSKSK